MKHPSVLMFCLLALLLAGSPSAQTSAAQNLAEPLGKLVVVENVTGTAGPFREEVVQNRIRVGPVRRG